MSFSFASDNASVVHPRIMEALSRCNVGSAPPYGADDLSKTLDGAYSALFEREAFVFPVSSGTAANGLALGAITPSYGAVFCHTLSHIMVSEAGAPEFYSGGCRLVPLDGGMARLTADRLAAALTSYGPGHAHQMKAAAVSLTQATERGTLYRIADIEAVAEQARSAGMKLHMDGARFANALVALGCSPAEMTWKAGVDAISFGTTKNGTMMAEAVIVFDRSLADAMRFQHKRAGFLHSKMRYFTAQLLAYVDDGLWLDNARRANAAAARIAARLAVTPGAELAFPVETNQLFVHLEPSLAAAFAAAGLRFRAWGGPKPNLHRLVMSYADDEALLARFEAVLAERTRSAQGQKRPPALSAS